MPNALKPKGVKIPPRYHVKRRYEWLYAYLVSVHENTVKRVLKRWRVGVYAKETATAVVKYFNQIVFSGYEVYECAEQNIM